MTKAIYLGLTHSDLAWAYHNLGITAVLQRKNSEAKAHFELAVKADPSMKESAEMLRQLGFPTK